MLRITLLLVLASGLLAKETAVTSWKFSDPIPLAPVMFGDSAVKTSDLLEQVKVELNKANRLTTVEAGPVEFLRFSTSVDRAAVLAQSYLSADGYVKTTLEVSGSRPLVVYAGGKEVAKATSADSGRYVASGELILDRTRTELLILTVSQKQDSGDWQIGAKVKQDTVSNRVVLVGTTLPERPAHFRYDAKLEDYSSLVMSPDGKHLLFKRSVREGDEHRQKSWFELWQLDKSALYYTFSEDRVSAFAFSDDGKKLYFKKSMDDGSEIWSFDMSTKAFTRLLPAIKDLEGFKVVPSGREIFYSRSEEKPENKSGYDLFRDMDDRPTGYNNRRELFAAEIGNGLTRQLTKAGEFEIQKWSVSPSGERILLVNNIPKLGRPYMRQEFWTLDVSSGKAAKVLNRSLLEYPQNIAWIDENNIAYCAGSHDASPEDTTYHNVNQLRLYTLNLSTGEHKNLTANQDFSVNDEGGHQRILFNPRDRKLYAHVCYRGERQFAGISLDGKSVTYRAVKTSFDFTDDPAYAKDGSRVAYVASDYNSPKAVYVNSLSTPAERAIVMTNQVTASQWELGTMEEWNFTNRLGIEIDGWLYKPADFTPDRKWPLIVYFYAGVSPRDERFSVQNQLWLANGYVVYVLNTVGAVGRGQEFADYHAGDWGTEATQDVIEGTQKLLAAHPYLDSERMGCFGGSYGGFITLDLLTKTKMFKVAIDMYGISNITNYFGGGTWGYWYSDLASPGQFPWSDRDVYVEKSPIYNADKIATPLLILHGGNDTNVPWLESDQMFVALKLLGRDVVYARFQNETHNINSKYENLILHRQMMLEWFDKYLKDQPEAWEARMSTWK